MRKDMQGIGEMKHTVRPAEPAATQASSASDPRCALKRINRIRLEFLDEYTCEKHGYDPYDSSRGRAPDIWSTKRKRP
jgi:hypothetical protein